MPPRARAKTGTSKKGSVAIAATAAEEPSSSDPVKEALMMIEYPRVEALSWRNRQQAAALPNPSNGAAAAMEWLEDFQEKLRKVQQNPSSDELVLPPLTATKRKRPVPFSAARQYSTEKRPRISGQSASKLARKVLQSSANRSHLNASANRSNYSPNPSSPKVARPRRKAAMEAAKRLTTTTSIRATVTPTPSVRATARRGKKHTTVAIDLTEDALLPPVQLDVAGETERQPDHLVVQAPSRKGSGRSFRRDISPVTQPSDETVHVIRMSQLMGPVTSTPNTAEQAAIRRSMHHALMECHSEQTAMDGHDEDNSGGCSSSNEELGTALANRTQQKQLRRTLIQQFSEEETQVILTVPPPQVEEVAEDVEMAEQAEDVVLVEDLPPGDVSMVAVETLGEVDRPAVGVMRTNVMPGRERSSGGSIHSSAGDATVVLPASVKAVDPAASLATFDSLSISVTIKNEISGAQNIETSRLSVHRTVVVSTEKPEPRTPTVVLPPDVPSTSAGTSRGLLIKSVRNSMKAGSPSLPATVTTVLSDQQPSILDVSMDRPVADGGDDSEWEADAEDETEISRNEPVCPPHKVIRPLGKHHSSKHASRKSLKKRSVAPPVPHPVVRPRKASQSTDRDAFSFQSQQNPRSTSPISSYTSSPSRRREGSAMKTEEAGRRREENIRMKQEEQKRKHDERQRRAHEKKAEMDRQREARVLEQIRNEQSSEKHRIDQDASQKQSVIQLTKQRHLDAEKRRAEEADRLKKQAQERLKFSPTQSLTTSSIKPTVKPFSKSQTSGMKAIPVGLDLHGGPHVTPVKVPKPSAVPAKTFRAGSKMQTPLPQVDLAGIKAAQKFMEERAGGGSNFKSTGMTQAVPTLAGLRTTASKEPAPLFAGGDFTRAKSPSSQRSQKSGDSSDPSTHGALPRAKSPSIATNRSEPASRSGLPAVAHPTLKTTNPPTQRAKSPSNRVERSDQSEPSSSSSSGLPPTSAAQFHQRLLNAVIPSSHPADTQSVPSSLNHTFPSSTNANMPSVPVDNVDHVRQPVTNAVKNVTVPPIAQQQPAMNRPVAFPTLTPIPAGVTVKPTVTTTAADFSRPAPKPFPSVAPADTTAKISPTTASTLASAKSVVTQQPLMTAPSVNKLDPSVKAPFSTSNVAAGKLPAPIPAFGSSSSSLYSKVVPTTPFTAAATAPISQAQTSSTVFTTSTLKLQQSTATTTTFATSQPVAVKEKPYVPVALKKPPNDENKEITTYGMDVQEDDDTDDEDRPKKQVPNWAQKDSLMGLIRRQLVTEIDLDRVFRGVRPTEKVNLTTIFKNETRRYERRTSSQMWPQGVGVLPLGIHTPLGRTGRTHASVPEGEDV